MAPPRVELCGANLRAFRDHTSKEIIISGPAGSGKTLANLLKIYTFVDRFPGARCLIARKTRESMTESVLVTWERDVLGPDHPVLLTNPNLRRVRQAYTFANGSTVVVGGLDKADKLLSSEWDVIYVPEVTDLLLTDWETLGGRLRANAGDYDQLCGDCNPGSPYHWTKKRCDEGKTRLGSTPSGTVTVVLYFANAPVVFSFAYNAPTATVLAAAVAAVPGWSGNLAVTGTAGTSYVFTFSNQMGNQSVGGNWTASVTSGTATWARTTAGSSSMQLDEYNASNNNHQVEGFLCFDVISSPTGARVAPEFGVAAGQATSSPYYATGIFAASDITGLDANAYTLGGILPSQGGTNVEIL